MEQVTTWLLPSRVSDWKRLLSATATTKVWSDIIPVLWVALWSWSLLLFIELFRRDLLNIAQTTLSSKIVRTEKEYFAKLCVDAVLRLKGSKNLDAINIIKKPGGSLTESYLEEGFILEKRIGVGCPKRIENAKVLIANTAMDADKIKVYGARVKTDSVQTVAEIEEVERVCE